MKAVFGRMRSYGRRLKYLLLFLLLFVPARLLRRFHARYRMLWLVAERGYDARDNGYRFFSYLTRCQPQINACFVISGDSPDREKVTALGKTVESGSLQHHLMYLAADYLVGTHVQPAAPNPWAYYRMAQYGLRAKGHPVFLQHGIIINDIKHLHYPRLRIDLFVCGAKPEFEHISAAYGHPAGVVRYLGLSRYDALYGVQRREREILLMPTWRSAAYPTGDAFLQTAFYKHYQAFLQSPELLELLERLDVRLIFYPHTELQKELHHFSSPSDRIVLADQAHYDVQTLLLRCLLLITDYSSVFFDVGYQGKPVIYYQFDEEEYRKYLYAEGYFSYRRDGFGPVVETQEALLASLTACAEAGFALPEEYAKRIERFFPMRDDKNCERTYQAILALSGGGRESADCPADRIVSLRGV